MWFLCFFFFFSSRRRHTRLQGDWSSDVCSSDLSKVGAVCVDAHVRFCAGGDQRWSSLPRHARRPASSLGIRQRISHSLDSLTAQNSRRGRESDTCCCWQRRSLPYCSWEQSPYCW